MVGFVRWRDIDSRSLQVIVEDRTKYRSSMRHNHEWFACQILRTDRFKRGETVVTRQDHHQRLLHEKTERQVWHRLFLSRGPQQVEGNIDSISLRQCSAARRAGYARLRASTSIRVRSESPSRSRAWRDERPGEQLRPPRQPAIELRARDRERLAPPVSTRRHELCAS